MRLSAYSPLPGAAVIWYRYGAIDSRASGDSPGKRFAIALRTIPGPPGPMSLTIPDDGISCSAGAGQAAEIAYSVRVKSSVNSPVFGEFLSFSTVVTV